MALELMYITNKLEIALIAQKHGVDRIWIDLEVLGKEERQKNRDTVKSSHKIEDISILKPALTHSKLLVRINPWNMKSEEEICEVINAGADFIMLPMWKSVKEVKNFINAVQGRVKTVLLLETKEAVDCISEVLELEGIDEIHIGLNDLHISYGLTFMFELLTNGIVEKMCQLFRSKGMTYGFGGIAKLGEGLIPAEKIILEHYRLGSTRAILSRSFCDTSKIRDVSTVDAIFEENMCALRNYERNISNFAEKVFDDNKVELENCVNEIVKIRTKMGESEK